MAPSQPQAATPVDQPPLVAGPPQNHHDPQQQQPSAEHPQWEASPAEQQIAGNGVMEQASGAAVHEDGASRPKKLKLTLKRRA